MATRKPIWPSSARLVAPSHTKRVFGPNDFRELVDLSAKKLAAIHKSFPFVALAGIGHSGVPLMAALSYKIGVPMIAVRRKSNETQHDYTGEWNGYYSGGPYLVVDDLISSGATLRRIISAIDKLKDSYSQPPSLLGCLLYRDGTENRYHAVQNVGNVWCWKLEAPDIAKPTA